MARRKALPRAVALDVAGAPCRTKSTRWVRGASKGRAALGEDGAGGFGLCPRQSSLSEFCVPFAFSAKLRKQSDSCTPLPSETPAHLLWPGVLPERLSETWLPRSLALPG